MVSTSEVCTGNSPITSNPSVYTKKPRSRKPFSKFSESLDFKHKTDVRKLGAAKENCKSTKTGNVLWPNTKKHRGYTNINNKVREALMGFYIILML